MSLTVFFHSEMTQWRHRNNDDVVYFYELNKERIDNDYIVFHYGRRSNVPTMTTSYISMSLTMFSINKERIDNDYIVFHYERWSNVPTMTTSYISMNSTMFSTQKQRTDNDDVVYFYEFDHVFHTEATYQQWRRRIFLWIRPCFPHRSNVPTMTTSYISMSLTISSTQKQHTDNDDVVFRYEFDHVLHTESTYRQWRRRIALWVWPCYPHRINIPTMTT